jgi:transposase InsO family protein
VRAHAQCQHFVWNSALPRISAELRRRGMVVNHKRVARIMREDNLLAVQPRSFVATTESDRKLEVYLNLARRMKLTGMDQLWVADITYIRLKTEFVYLAVILDGFSRKVGGLVAGAQPGQPFGRGRLGPGNRSTGTTGRISPSFRSGRAIRQRGIRRGFRKARDDSEYEPPGKSLR